MTQLLLTYNQCFTLTPRMYIRLIISQKSNEFLSQNPITILIIYQYVFHTKYLEIEMEDKTVAGFQRICKY